MYVCLYPIISHPIDIFWGVSLLLWLTFSLVLPLEREPQYCLLSNAPGKGNLIIWCSVALTGLHWSCSQPRPVPSLCELMSAYRIFILLSAKVSSCLVTVMWMDQMNCSVLSLLQLKPSSSAALALDKWLPVSIFIRISCATDNAALVAALDTSSRASTMQVLRELLASWSCWTIPEATAHQSSIFQASG